jgi:hypothetical protein
LVFYCSSEHQCPGFFFFFSNPNEESRLKFRNHFADHFNINLRIEDLSYSHYQRNHYL